MRILGAFKKCAEMRLKCVMKCSILDLLSHERHFKKPAFAKPVLAATRHQATEPQKSTPLGSLRDCIFLFFDFEISFELN